jgi:putative membrane protein
MMIFGFIFFSRGGFRPPWMQGSERVDNKSSDLESPLDLLKRRYAKGEITKEEFEQMKKDLEG